MMQNITRHFSRRKFLRGAAALSVVPVAAASLSRWAVAQSTASTERTIYKSLKWGMIQTKSSALEKFRMLARLGFDGVELDSPDGTNPREALAAAQETGVVVDGVVDSRHWQVRMTDPDEKVRDQAGQDLLTAITDSSAAGGNSVLLVPGHGQDGEPDAIKQHASEQIQRALPSAARHGVHILIENVWNHMFYDHDGPANQTADELVAFVDQFDSPWLGVQFDIGNHQKYGSPGDWIRTLRRRIVKLDVKDWGAQNGFCKLGDGDVDWSDVRAALAEIHFTGWAAAEVAGGDEPRLRDISQRMDRVLQLPTRGR